MLKTEVDLGALIKSYTQSTQKDGIFISILESDDNLAHALNLSRDEILNLLYGYLYLTDFNGEEDMENLFNKIVETSHEDSQYMVMVKNGEIIREHPDY
ncbi:hypothetical protein [Priestia megaterium]|uniref:hypothetical protein n=1 Tax=Priestia megaterium TaxID=1404 RepID=UPI001127EC49|nr:hypothetical protein [Priestia megaterium]TPF17992.1 hypothetical protein CBE78_01840 [Priestia megaterium]TPF22100.1 hypothetical protein CBE79_04345 [Priestia megaterium]